jgi:myo-inositol 2-dehydrogenase/D-chiro-inositol 1-dehydrogenase
MTTLGIVGAGRIGKLHAANIAKLPGVRVKTISDVFTDGLAEWAATVGIGHTTGDYTEMLQDPDIDAVLICSSTDTHPDIIVRAARAGKHIFCEKPVSFDLAQTVRALQAVEEAGVKLQVGFVRRFDPSFKRVRDQTREGAIGEPHLIKITSRDPAPPSEAYLKVCGGLFLDQTIHDFDMARYLSGSDVVEVYACGEVLVDPVFRRYDDIDTAVTTLKFANGAIGVIDNSRKAVYGYDQRIEVFGSQGCLTADNVAPTTAKWYSADGVVSDKPPYFFLERYNEAFIQEISAFIESVANGREVPVSGQDGYQAELIAHAARKSWLEHRPVKLEELKEDGVK